jgi:hypothetical protein
MSKCRRWLIVVFLARRSRTSTVGSNQTNL